ncbi:hypothetical protein QQF64_010638 [Cirrhinus molitorella]|uniref:Uncharacterized protein n=1 Tax=Cirrhinus molitorella TaxID=172907 RepID=A0ABR3M024_9TELE
MKTPAPSPRSTACNLRSEAALSHRPQFPCKHVRSAAPDAPPDLQPPGQILPLLFLLRFNTPSPGTLMQGLCQIGACRKGLPLPLEQPPRCHLLPLMPPKLFHISLRLRDTETLNTKITPV